MDYRQLHFDEGTALGAASCFTPQQGASEMQILLTPETPGRVERQLECLERAIDPIRALDDEALIGSLAVQRPTPCSKGRMPHDPARAAA